MVIDVLQKRVSQCQIAAGGHVEQAAEWSHWQPSSLVTDIVDLQRVLSWQFALNTEIPMLVVGLPETVGQGVAGIPIVIESRIFAGQIDRQTRETIVP